jgi:hypothetical protein
MSHTDNTLQFPLARATAVSMFIRLWCVHDKISWLGGVSRQWRPPQGLSEHKHCDNTATTLIRTTRTLEAEWWLVLEEEWVRGQRKMSQVLGTFGLLDFTMLRSVLVWGAFWSLWTIYFSNFPNFFRAAANGVYGGPPVYTQQYPWTLTDIITRKIFDLLSLPRTAYHHVLP